MYGEASYADSTEEQACVRNGYMKLREETVIYYIL